MNKWPAAVLSLAALTASAGCGETNDTDGSEIDETPPTVSEVFAWLDGRHESALCTVLDDQGNIDFDAFCTGQFQGVTDNSCTPLVVVGDTRAVGLEGSSANIVYPAAEADYDYFDSTSTISGSLVATTLCYHDGTLAFYLMASGDGPQMFAVADGQCDDGGFNIEHTAGGSGGLRCVVYDSQEDCSHDYCD